MAAGHTGSGATWHRLGGVLPVFQTPFEDDESIDFDTLDGELDWLFEHGADGCMMALVSEVLRLSTDEREELAAHVCRAAGGRRPVVVSAGAESSHTAVRLARHAERHGARAVMAIPPVSTALSDDELLRYYRRIFEAVGLPVIVQDAGGYLGKPMSIAVQLRILDEFGEWVYFKSEVPPIGPRLSALRESTGGLARVFEGSGGIALVESYRRGIVWTMPGADIVDAILVLWKALKAGDDRLAYQLSLPVASLVAMPTSLDAYLAVEKYLLVKRGIFKNTIVRGPVAYRLDDEARREVDRLFELLAAALDSDIWS